MNESKELFSNIQLDIGHLPEAEKMEMVVLEPVYKMVRYISGGIIALIMCVVGWTFVMLRPDIWPLGLYLGAFLTLIAIWIIIYQGASYHYMGYALREKDITFKSGWFWRSMTTIPFNRVQHCDLKQGILDRRFGLSKLTIYTAGGQSTDLEIPGLLPETAEKLKAYILRSTELAAEED
jgi:membrane protein YdbS with pleckstrin-like domain